MTLLLYQSLPNQSASQKSKHPLKHIYFNKDISRTICLSLVQCVFSRTCPKLQEFRLVLLLYKHNNLKYVIIARTKGKMQARAYCLKPKENQHILET